MICGQTRQWRDGARALGCVFAAMAAALALSPAAAAAPAVGVVAGTVTSVDGAALRGVTVEMVYIGLEGFATPVASTTTGHDGRYRLAGGFEGSDLQLQFSAAGATGGTSSTGYADLCYRGAPWCAQGGAFVQVAAGARFTADVTLARAGGITGRAVDALGRGVGGFPVTLWFGAVDQAADAFVRPFLFATTDVNGNYAFPGVAAWNYGMCFGNGNAFPGGQGLDPGTPARDGYVDRCFTGTGGTPRVVTAAGRTTVRNVLLAGAGAATGKVVDADGRPVAGAAVEPNVPLPESSATTAADGGFRLGMLAPGSQEVCVDAPGFRGYCVDFEVTSFVTFRLGSIVLTRTT